MGIPIRGSFRQHISERRSYLDDPRTAPSRAVNIRESSDRLSGGGETAGGVTVAELIREGRDHGDFQSWTSL